MCVDDLRRCVASLAAHAPGLPLIIVENGSEDGSFELLRGEFQGKDKIVVDVFKDDEGKTLRLDFRGEVVEKSEPVGAVAGEGEEGGEDSSE